MPVAARVASPMMRISMPEIMSTSSPPVIPLGPGPVCWPLETATMPLAAAS